MTRRSATPEDAAMIWEWLMAFPDAQLQDGGPQTLVEFTHELGCRLESGEAVEVVSDARGPCGSIGYAVLSHQVAALHGIAFAPQSLGAGTATAALRSVLNDLWSRGVRKTMAVFYADNVRARRLFERVGAVEEGYFRRHATQGGIEKDMRVMAMFAPESEG